MYSPEMTILEAVNISYKYPHARENAVHKLSFSIEKGSYTAVLGPNGSGKSTLARLLAGIIEVQDGFITYSPEHPMPDPKTAGYENLRKHPLESVPWGIVFQSPKHQIIAGKVIRDAAFGPGNLGFPRTAAELKADKELTATSLSHKRDANTLALSLGQTQKLALSGVLAMNPEVLILDEAVSMIDPGCRKEILDYIDSLHTLGKTIISVTHDKDEALRSDRILVMNKGSILFSGTPSEFLSASQVQQDIFGTGTIGKRKSARRSAGETAILLDAVSFSYNTKTFFNSVSLSFAKGSLTAVMGESGSGKSTMFELITGLLKPSEGSVSLGGAASLALQDSEAALFEEFAVDDAAFGPGNKGIKGKEMLDKVQNAMNTAGLDYETYKNKRTFSLSGGEKRKLALAGIIALDEDIMLFDEPTAGLDPKSRLNILTALQNLADKGKTIVFSTHRSDEALAADRIITLHDGSVIDDSSPFSPARTDNLKHNSPGEAGILAKIRNSIQGDFEKKNSPVHKAHPAVQFLLFFSLFSLSIILQSIPVLSGVAGLCILYSAAALYPVKKLIRRIMSVMPWIAVFFVFQLLFFGTGSQDTVLWRWGFISITETKLFLTVRTILHFLGAVITFSVYFYSTEESSIIDGLASVLKPLSFIGFPVRHICLLILLVLRFIPLLLDETANILKTQIIRGGIKKQKGFLKTIRAFIPLLTPLILQTLKRAETLTEAITARYYH